MNEYKTRVRRGDITTRLRVRFVRKPYPGSTHVPHTKWTALVALLSPTHPGQENSPKRSPRLSASPEISAAHLVQTAAKVFMEMRRQRNVEAGWVSLVAAHDGIAILGKACRCLEPTHHLGVQQKNFDCCAHWPLARRDSKDIQDIVTGVND